MVGLEWEWEGEGEGEVAGASDRDDWCDCESSVVANACAPVSPRGSPPRLELLRRRVRTTLALCCRVVLGLTSGGKASG